MGLHQWGNPSITGALAVTGIAGVPDATIGVTNDDTEIRFAPIDSMVSTISSHTGVTQTGDDDIVLLCAINKTIGGNLIDATRHGTSMQLESNFLTGGFRYSEWNWDWAYSDGAARDSSKDRRPLAARVRFDTQASEVSSSGQFTFYNSARDTELAEVNTSGDFEFRGRLYTTVGGNKTLIQAEKNTPGTTWSVMSLTSADKAVLNLDAAGATDGTINMGTAGQIKGKISSTTATLAEITAGYAIFADTNVWSGVYLRNGATNSGDGIVLEVGGVFGIQVKQVSSVTRIGLYATTPTIQGQVGATLTNNVTPGGTANQLDDWTSLTVYATDAAAIRNAVYQLGLKLSAIEAKLKLLGAIAT